MNAQNDPEMQAAMTEWKKKYNIAEGDPLLAMIDLFRIQFGNAQATPQNGAPYIPSFVEFRDSLELLGEYSKQFSKQAAELIEVLRGVPNTRKRARSVIFVLAILCALVVGVLIGMFLR